VVVVVVFLLAEMGNHLRLVAPPAAFSLILLLCLGSSPLVSSVQFMEMTVRTGRSIESEADVDYLISKALDTHIKGRCSILPPPPQPPPHPSTISLLNPPHPKHKACRF